jgi:hypothetical protein
MGRPIQHGRGDVLPDIVLLQMLPAEHETAALTPAIWSTEECDEALHTPDTKPTLCLSAPLGR